MGSDTAVKSILIGNGVNLCSEEGCVFFSPTAIKKRFCTALEASLSNIPFDNLRIGIGNAIPLVQESDNSNIEELAALVFNAVCNEQIKRSGFFSGNDDQRLKRILKTAAIDSIFLEKGRFKVIEIWEKTRVSIGKYSKIFTLNYYEYWDAEGRAVFQHNRIERQEATGAIKGAEQCIFSPLRDLPKSQADALYPSEYLYPSGDLVPSGLHALYSPLEGMECIDIFGVSPFGDSELLDCIKKISKKRIFIYEIAKNNTELTTWLQRVGDADYLDVKEFYCA